MSVLTWSIITEVGSGFSWWMFVGCVLALRETP